MRNPRLLITAIALLLLGLVVNHFMQRPPAPQFAPDLQGAPAARAPARATPGKGNGLPAFLPAEARQTIALIQRGGPFPHRRMAARSATANSSYRSVRAATTANTPWTPRSAHPWHAPHRHRRRSAGGVVLHRRPLRIIPQLHRTGPGAQ